MGRCACEGSLKRLDDGTVSQTPLREVAGYYQCNALRDFAVLAREPFVNFLPAPTVVDSEAAMQAFREVRGKHKNDQQILQLVRAKMEKEFKKDVEDKERIRKQRLADKGKQKPEGEQQGEPAAKTQQSPNSGLSNGLFDWTAATEAAAGHGEDDSWQKKDTSKATNKVTTANAARDLDLDSSLVEEKKYVTHIGEHV